MPTLEKLLLAGSNSGRPIAISVTGSAGTTIHTTTTGSAIIDEVWLYSSYTGTGTQKVTVEFGNTTASDRFETSVTGSVGLYLLSPGLTISASGSTASTIRAFATTGSGVTIAGYVNRYTP